MTVKRIHNECLFTDFVGVCKRVGGKLEALTAEDEDLPLSFEDAMNKEYATYTCRIPKGNESKYSDDEAAVIRGRVDVITKGNKLTYSEYDLDVERRGDANISLSNGLSKILNRATSIRLVGNRILVGGYAATFRPTNPDEKKRDKVRIIDMYL